MLCHGGCGTKLTLKNRFTRTLQSIAKEAGVNVLALEEHDLRSGNQCGGCALFRAATGETWQRYAFTLELLQRQQTRVRVVNKKILLPQKVAEPERLSI